MMRRRPLSLLPLLWAACLAACTTTPTQVIVLVDAEAGVAARADALEIRVEGRASRSTKGTEVLDTRIDVDAERWPVRLALEPEGGDADRVFKVSVRALDGDEPLAAAAVLSSYVDGEARWVRLLLEDACLGLADACDARDDETCRGGSCASGWIETLALGKNAGDAPSSAAPGGGSGGDGDGDGDGAQTVDGGGRAGTDADASTGEPTDPASCPGIEEICNGIDDDCDKAIDEDLSRDCGSEVGSCTAGEQTCDAGKWGTCIDADGMQAVTKAAENCDSAGDEDCDGSSDEGCTCVGTGSRECGSDVGACKLGTQRCAGGMWGACDGQVAPVDELCNNADDDCDGDVDEDVTQSCGSDVGACEFGTQTCTAGSWSICLGATEATTESCDLVDQDCDSVVDERLGCVRTGATFGQLFGASPLPGTGVLRDMDIGVGGQRAVAGYACTQTSGGQGCEIWVAKLNADLSIAWSDSYSGGYDSYQYFNGNEGYGVAVDSSGAVIAVGSTCDGGTTDSCAIWIRKYLGNGDVVFTKIISDASEAWARAVAVDSQDNILVTGFISAQFGNGDVWTRKYSPSGSELWTRTYDGGASETDIGEGIAIDGDDAVLVAGTVTIPVSSSTEQRGWLRKYSAAGDVLWSQEYSGSSGGAQAHAVAVDSQGNAFVMGSRMNASGQPGWLRRYAKDGTGGAIYPLTIREAWGIAVDRTDAVVTVGYQSVSGQSNNLWVRRWENDLSTMWTVGYDQFNGSDQGFGAAVDADLNVYAVGSAQDEDNFTTFLIRIWGP